MIRKLIATEMQEQMALVQWIQTQTRLRNFLIKLNNEGKRNAYQGYNLKRLGMCVGASDLFLALPTKRHHGLWLEIKQNRKYSPSQRNTRTWIAQENFLELMKSVGFDAHFCYGWQHGKELVEGYSVS